MSGLVNAVREVLGLDPIPHVNEHTTEHEHGTIGCYREGCRCAPCQAANSERSRKYREKAKRGQP